MERKQRKQNAIFLHYEYEFCPITGEGNLIHPYSAPIYVLCDCDVVDAQSINSISHDNWMKPLFFDRNLKNIIFDNSLPALEQHLQHLKSTLVKSFVLPRKPLPEGLSYPYARPQQKFYYLESRFKAIISQMIGFIHYIHSTHNALSSISDHNFSMANNILMFRALKLVDSTPSSRKKNFSEVVDLIQNLVGNGSDTIPPTLEHFYVLSRSLSYNENNASFPLINHFAFQNPEKLWSFLLHSYSFFYNSSSRRFVSIIEPLENCDNWVKLFEKKPELGLVKECYDRLEHKYSQKGDEAKISVIIFSHDLFLHLSRHPNYNFSPEQVESVVMGLFSDRVLDMFKSLLEKRCLDSLYPSSEDL